MAHICDLRFFLYHADITIYKKFIAQNIAIQASKAGFTAKKNKGYRCCVTPCDKSHFLLDYSYRASLPEIKKQTLDIGINASGIRDTSQFKYINNNGFKQIKKEKIGFRSILIFSIIIQKQK